MLVGHFIAEMGIWLLARLENPMNTVYLKPQKLYYNPPSYQQAPSLLESSAEMKGNIHVLPSWMMAKAK
ncbi:hypothetical protein [Colwellia sp. KU-HH00111]|uniref:hypothetical protein n=1 Tax=Colwellia sp. KU-HH00111 TaxID=3127652 RepID=UPI003365A6EE